MTPMRPKTIAKPVAASNRTAPILKPSSSCEKISSIAPAADPITKKVKIEISYNNKNQDLIPGTFVEITIPVKQTAKSKEGSFFIPLRALNITQSEAYVFIVKEGLAHKIAIKTGESSGELIEVLSGLEPNNELIIAGGKSLEDQEKVNTQK